MADMKIVAMMMVDTMMAATVMIESVMADTAIPNMMTGTIGVTEVGTQLTSDLRFPNLTVYVDSRARPEDSRERNNRYDGYNGYNGYNEGNGYHGECKWRKAG
jgi:hypothetical protein